MNAQEVDKLKAGAVLSVQGAEWNYFLWQYGTAPAPECTFVEAAGDERLIVDVRFDRSVFGRANCEVNLHQDDCSLKNMHRR